MERVPQRCCGGHLGACQFANGIRSSLEADYHPILIFDAPEHHKYIIRHARLLRNIYAGDLYIIVRACNLKLLKWACLIVVDITAKAITMPHPTLECITIPGMAAVSCTWIVVTQINTPLITQKIVIMPYAFARSPNG